MQSPTFFDSAYLILNKGHHFLLWSQSIICQSISIQRNIPHHHSNMMPFASWPVFLIMWHWLWTHVGFLSTWLNDSRFLYQAWNAHFPQTLGLISAFFFTGPHEVIITCQFWTFWNVALHEITYILLENLGTWKESWHRKSKQQTPQQITRSMQSRG